MRTPLRLRSLLFAPASRPDVLAKLPRANPDGVVLDLEDAVAPSAKADAREHSREAGAMLAREHPHLAVYVRVNAIPTEWFADDIARGVPAERNRRRRAQDRIRGAGAWRPRRALDRGRLATS